jgi:hypothetical protein
MRASVHDQAVIKRCCVALLMAVEAEDTDRVAFYRCILEMSCRLFLPAKKQWEINGFFMLEGHVQNGQWRLAHKATTAFVQHTLQTCED